jgi:hypothetical protein
MTQRMRTVMREFSRDRSETLSYDLPESTTTEWLVGHAELQEYLAPL